MIIRSPLGGTITVNGAITGVDDASVTITGAGSTTVLNAGITTAGNFIQINDAVQLGANVTLDTTNGGASAAGANIGITGTTNADAAANDRTLTLRAGTGGVIRLGGTVRGSQPLNTLTIRQREQRLAAGDHHAGRRDQRHSERHHAYRQPVDRFDDDRRRGVSDRTDHTRR